ncbi:uncharacterized protein [Clytia hemisphaerica]|uniref:uncharacterized protein n=1 Tax=Clytia hemisphaerica TaxID=252671 RepID=UPI0034D6A217
MLAERSNESKSVLHNFTTPHNKRVFSMFLPDHWNICCDSIAPNILIKPDQNPFGLNSKSTSMFNVQRNFPDSPGNRLSLRSSTPQEEDITPWHWPKGVSLEGGRLDVKPNKKKQITQQFKTSIGRNVTVLDVKEICNARFYKKYQSKQKKLAEKLGKNNVNEQLELYHGTA